MLKSISILILLALASAEDILQDEDDLKFHVVTAENIEIPPTIQVRFSNGEQDDLVLKHYRINEHAEVGCNYLGHLQNDPYSSVAVTGCLNSPEDKLEITMVSDNYLKTVSVDFRGNTQKIKSPYEEKGLHTTLRNDKEWNQSDDEIINDNLEKQAQNAKTSSIPSKLRATIKFGYEDTMKEWLGSQDFDSWIQAPLVHAQAIYKHKSLGTEIEFEVVGKAIYQKGARWVTIGDDYRSWYAAIAATQASMLNEPAVVYSWWCSADNWAGALGAMSALCQDNNINLNMRIDGALKNGMMLAHELGHNFGMMHDWDDNLGGVGGPCDGDGLMSYGWFDQPLRWSSCSRTSFEQHYFGLNWGCNCLLDISEDNEGQNHCEALDQCPDSHPHAYYDGHYCCASDYEKIYEPQGTKCDGGKLQYDSMCCGNDEYIACPSGVCSNTADEDNGDGIDLCGHSCQSVIAMSAPCSTTWEMGCGTIDPPEGFTSKSTLYELCPNECPDEGQNDPKCEDKLSSKRCEKRKALGKCSKKGIQKKCQKTCGLCA